MEKNITVNRKARHEYFLEEFYEAGIELTGTEIKSIRQGRVQLKDAYIEFIGNEALSLKCIFLLMIMAIFLTMKKKEKGDCSYTNMKSVL